MLLYNLSDNTEQVNFTTAVMMGLGRNRGLFFPKEFPHFTQPEIDQLLQQDLVSRSSKILSAFIGNEFSLEQVTEWVRKAFTFTAPVTPITKQIASLELYHGPTLAFKDFGARFMAQTLSYVATMQPSNKKITILTATSGDTGAAVAHAFHKVPNIDIVVLYPKNKISPLQEKLFCCLGDNITTVAVNSDFDACQALVKQAFSDQELAAQKRLNSANSIHISRLLAQICYYFEAVAQLTEQQRQNLVFSVPSGNFGNLTAGILAKISGLPIKRFIAATNLNDTVPRYLQTKQWQPNKTVATISNAMDVSDPSNWTRIEFLLQQNILKASDLSAISIDEETTKQAMRKLASLGYISEPHAAVAYQALVDSLAKDEYGVFLGTAHPAKFNTVVEDILKQPIELPTAIAENADKTVLSIDMSADFQQFKQWLLQHNI